MLDARRLLVRPKYSQLFGVAGVSAQAWRNTCDKRQFGAACSRISFTVTAQFGAALSITALDRACAVLVLTWL